jgi:hypothetical protein
MLVDCKMKSMDSPKFLNMSTGMHIGKVELSKTRRYFSEIEILFLQRSKELNEIVGDYASDGGNNSHQQKKEILKYSKMKENE